MQLHEITRKTPNKDKKRVGRGGKRGKTSGRGTKGQKARAGHKIRPDYREKLKKLPKLRGYRMKSIEKKPLPVNLATLEAAFAAGEKITPTLLIERGVVRVRKGSLPAMKILGTGDLTKKFSIVGFTISESAKAKIEKAGGSVE